MAWEWLAKGLRTKAQMIRMGEKIEPFSECDLMEEAARVLEDDAEVLRIMSLPDEQVVFEARTVAWLRARATKCDEAMRGAPTVEGARRYEGARDELDMAADMIERGKATKESVNAD